MAFSDGYSRKVVIELTKPVRYKEVKDGVRVDMVLPVGTRLPAYDNGTSKDGKSIDGYFPSSPFGIYRDEAKVIEKETGIYMVEVRALYTKTVHIEADSDEEAEKMVKTLKVQNQLLRAKKLVTRFAPTVRFLRVKPLSKLPRKP